MPKDVNSTQVKLDPIFEESGSSGKQVTKGSTEADLEARIDGAIRIAFPCLPHTAIRHQTTFSFQFGGKKITVDGKDKTHAQARSDVILYFKEKPLAVLELKKSGSVLSEEDSQQGLSYARVLNPSPPLVVVSNGQDVRFIETYTGQDWNPIEHSEQILQGLFQSVAKVAAGDLKLAVSTLMATNPEVWIQAVRKTTDANIDELSGDWSDRLLPFVRGFVIPRKATQAVIKFLRCGSKLVIVEGAPLSGKSNVLRELAQCLKTDSALVVLFIESDGAATVLQQLADTLTQQLDWPVSKDDARTWLKNLSHSDGPHLVVAIDGIGLDIDKSRDEIVDLISPIFGTRLSIVVELDDACAEAVVLNSTGRKASAIGRRADRVQVDPLDDAEFSNACDMLWSQRLAMSNGSQSSPELHLPWVLRAIGSRLMAKSKHGDPNLAVFIPPLLSLDLIYLTRNKFEDGIRISFRAIAKAALEDAEDRKRPISLILESMCAYVVRRKSLKKHLEYSELQHLQEQGYLKLILHESGEDVFVVRVPELVASEAAWVVADRIVDRKFQSSEIVAKWLTEVAANLPFGDIIVAQAIVDAAIQGHSIPFKLIDSLLKCPPRKEILKEGDLFAMHMPGTGTVRMRLRSDGLSVETTPGIKQIIRVDPKEIPNIIYVDVHGWLILSHLAGVPCVFDKEGSNIGHERVDPFILLEIGTCPMILRRPMLDQDIGDVITHEIDGHGSMACHKSGIVESVTLSIFTFLCSEGRASAEWIQTALAKGSFPMLMRLEIALREISNLEDAELSAFAQEVLTRWVQPAFSKFPLIH